MNQFQAVLDREKNPETGKVIDFSVDVGDSLKWAERLPDRSVHLCVTSPPYFGLRAYLKENDKAKSHEIGTEETPDEYVEKLVTLFRHIRRCLHPSGQIWVNLGDSFCGGGGFAPDAPSNKVGSISGGQDRGTGTKKVGGVKPQGVIKDKDLIGIPWMTAFALRADGWYLRQWAPWVKRSCLPESVTDRPTTACEVFFQLTKRPDYFFNLDAVKRPGRTVWAGKDMIPRGKYADEENETTVRTAAGGASRNNRTAEKKDDRQWRNSDFWFDSVGMLTHRGQVLGLDVTPASHRGEHTAVYPEKLISPIIQCATSKRGVCSECGAPQMPVIERTKVPVKKESVKKQLDRTVGSNGSGSSTLRNAENRTHENVARVAGWEPSCECEGREWVPAVVMDPFSGSGTTGAVARGLGLRFVGCELNRDYAASARNRISNVNSPGLQKFRDGS